MSAAVAAALVPVGCGGGDDDSLGTAAPESTPPLTVIQTARSGSFLRDSTGADLELVLRGAGGSSALGSAGAIATPKLFESAGDLLGPEPLRASLAGAEVNPLRYALLLRDPRYDGTLGTIRYRAEVAGGQPSLPPASFGAATLTIDSSLPAAAASGSVLRGDGGTPLVGALITLERGRRAIFTTLTGGGGSFSLPSLPTGSYLVEASLEDFEREQAELTLPAEGGLSFELDPIPGEAPPASP